ncbi:MAG: hypothetical protein NTW86_01380, partial [Candidatus Sumerlaeota bacterium]|nr:hypothetical protein [Candidatus Sumerlaeota bacterium]
MELPILRDELQYHAIGCYSVVHRIKQEMRAAEDLAVAAEFCAEKFIADRKVREDAAAAIGAAWRPILFNQFHDIFAGTGIRPAYEHASDELGSAKAACRGIIADAVRRVAILQPPVKEQQVVFVNMSKTDFEGFIDFEPWLGYIEREAKVDAYLVDEAGAEVPSQQTRTESAFWGVRLFARLAIPGGGKRTLRIRRDRAGVYETGVRAADAVVSNALVAASLDAGGLSFFGSAGQPSLLRALVRVVAIEDASDTWSHRIDSYTGPVCGEFTSPSPWKPIEAGPLRAGMMNAMTLGASTLRWQVFAQADEPIVRM